MASTKKSSTKRAVSKKQPAQKVKTIRQTAFVPSAPEEVYDAFLDAKKHSAFTGGKATCERHVGGKFTAWDGYCFGKNLKLQNSKRIVQEWKTTEWPKGYKPSILELTLKAKSGGTEIRLVQKNVPTVQAADYAKGWTDFYWKPLKKYFGKK